MLLLTTHLFVGLDFDFHRFVLRIGLYALHYRTVFVVVVAAFVCMGVGVLVLDSAVASTTFLSMDMDWRNVMIMATSCFVSIPHPIATAATPGIRVGTTGLVVVPVFDSLVGSSSSTTGASTPSSSKKGARLDPHTCVVFRLWCSISARCRTTFPSSFS